MGLNSPNESMPEIPKGVWGTILPHYSIGRWALSDECIIECPVVIKDDESDGRELQAVLDVHHHLTDSSLIGWSNNHFNNLHVNIHPTETHHLFHTHTTHVVVLCECLKRMLLNSWYNPYMNHR